MNAFPVVERELRVRGRRAWTQWWRVVVAAFASTSTVFVFVAWGGGGADVEKLGGLAFQALAWMGFLGACLGFLFTVDCLSSERRAGTLGLLMVTRVGQIGVLLGKLTANGISALFALMALAPAFMLPVLAGGVSGVEVVRTVAGCFSMLTFTLCLGLYASSESNGLGESLARGIIWFGFVMILSLVAGVCPVGALLDADPANPSGVGGGFWPGVSSGPLLGLLFLGFAGQSLRRNWKERAERREPSPTVRLEPVQAPKRVGETNPLVWLLRRDGARIAVIWLAALLGLPPIFLGAGRAGVGGVFGAVSVLTTVGSAALFAYAGARFMIQLRQSGTFELLHATPVGIARLARVQWSVVRGELFVPLLLLGSFTLLQRIGFLGVAQMPNVPGMTLVLVSVLAPPMQVLADALALCWLGMWFGLRSRRTVTAILWSIGLVQGLDLAIHAGFMSMHALWQAGMFPLAVSIRGVAFGSALMIPLTSILKQAWLIHWARGRLNQRLGGGRFESVNLNGPVRQPIGPALDANREVTPEG